MPNLSNQQSETEVRFSIPKCVKGLRRCRQPHRKDANKVTLARPHTIPLGMTKDWMLTYSVIGTDEFMKMGSANKAYE